LPVYANESAIFDDSLIPSIVEWASAKARNTREPSQLVFASPTLVGSRALGAHPDDESAFLLADFIFMQSIVVAWPSIFLGDESLQINQSLKPITHTDRDLLRSRGSGQQG